MTTMWKERKITIFFLDVVSLLSGMSNFLKQKYISDSKYYSIKEYDQK